MGLKGLVKKGIKEVGKVDNKAGAAISSAYRSGSPSVQNVVRGATTPIRGITDITRVLQQTNPNSRQGQSWMSALKAKVKKIT